jgi:hypothetical protein
LCTLVVEKSVRYGYRIKIFGLRGK